ncbi:MAG: GDSL-type esterase/lipase family protein, partial [Polyangiaceae bacterium]
SASAAPVVEAPPRVETVPELARFYGALRGLADHSRKSHVRVYWMGDSHAQADFWSGALRTALQDKFGDGGPGFLHLGYKDYRHDGAKFTVHGKWRMRPKKPSGVKHEADGVFGLGGIAMGGTADAPSAKVELTKLGAAPLFDFVYRMKEPHDRIAIEATGVPSTTLTASKDEPEGVLRHATFRGELPSDADGHAEFCAAPAKGSPDFLGLVVETDAATNAGVVLDTLGINGARYATALAWDEKAWEAEVSRRPPDLVVLEYGTNEAGEHAEKYDKLGGQVDALLARVRASAPNADCVIVSATDRVDAEETVPKVNAELSAAATRLGCFWFDAYTRMGGKGAMARMRDEEEPRVQKDGIHLTIKGYREYGKVLYDALMAGY